MAEDESGKHEDIDEEGIKKKLLGDEGLEQVVSELDQGIAKLEEMRDQIEPQTPHEDDEFNARMATLLQKGKQVESRRSAEKAERSRRFDQEKDSAQGLGVGLTIAYAIIGAPILGYFLGLGIDRLTHRNDAAYYALGGVVLGFVAAIQIAQRQNAKK